MSARKIFAAAAVVVSSAAIAACGSSSSTTSNASSAMSSSTPTAMADTSSSMASTTSSAMTDTTAAGTTSVAAVTNGTTSGTVALLLPENQTTRYETQDKPLFEKDFSALCSGCKVIYSNADQDTGKQLSQAQAALTQGAKVLVLDPVDATAAVAIVTAASAKNVPVVSYDRLIASNKVAYYVSYDNSHVGVLQGQALVAALKSAGKSSGNLIMINGSPTDPNAGEFKKGAHSIIDSSGYKVAKEYDTPDWAPATAQTEAQQAITAIGKGNFVGIYSANDGMAAGIVAAEKSQGIDPTTIPMTGQDAQLDGIQRVLEGTQAMTIYKAIKPEAQDAATAAYALLSGQSLPAGLVTSQQSAGGGTVPSTLLGPVAVTASNVQSTVVADGFWTAAQICTSAYAAACTKNGVS